MSSDDDWETDPDAINDVSEKQQRWGNKGTGKMVDLKAVQAEVRKMDEDKAKTKSGFQRGYGGAHGHEASGARRCIPAPACVLRRCGRAACASPRARPACRFPWPAVALRRASVRQGSAAEPPSPPMAAHVGPFSHVGDQTTASAPGKKVWQPKSSFEEKMAGQRSKEEGAGGAAAAAPAPAPPKAAPAVPSPASPATPAPTPPPKDPLTDAASPPAAAPPATPPPKPPTPAPPVAAPPAAPTPKPAAPPPQSAPPPKPAAPPPSRPPGPPPKPAAPPPTATPPPTPPAANPLSREDSDQAHSKGLAAVTGVCCVCV